MTQVVPQVRFQGEQLGPLRLYVEIRDARRMIWSQIEHTQPLTPEAEAEQLMKFVRTKQVIAESGPFSPPPRQQKVLQHDLAVAAHLKRLEQQSPALFLDTPRLDHE
jgi:hypothetical protein